jgi:hypothetical protein
VNDLLIGILIGGVGGFILGVAWAWNALTKGK